MSLVYFVSTLVIRVCVHGQAATRPADAGVGRCNFGKDTRKPDQATGASVERQSEGERMSASTLLK